jgi:hypothetical protein
LSKGFFKVIRCSFLPLITQQFLFSRVKCMGNVRSSADAKVLKEGVQSAIAPYVLI